jgi:hypothetical protein
MTDILAQFVIIAIVHPEEVKKSAGQPNLSLIDGS